jgi:NAD(P)-dependent dehydrogenase (short-subunit alcohol dehydrogenase family)
MWFKIQLMGIVVHMTFNPLDLTGRTVMVTGASSGIGRATSLLLGQLGANVILVARRQEELEQTLQLLEPGDHYICPFDLSNVEEIPQWLQTVTAERGVLGGLVHSAGVQYTRPLQSITQETVHKTFKINVEAAIALLKGSRQKGVFQPQSSIVLLSSVMGLVGEPGQVLYSASKGALVALSKSAAIELARQRIRVNCVAPAVVQTEMSGALQASLTPEQFLSIESKHPLGIGTPQDVANAIAFLLADTGRWITGTTLVVDGGYTAH